MIYEALYISLFVLVSCQDAPKVKTTYGWVRGGFTKTRGGRQILEFLGIPYAKPPVDTLRYQSPEPIAPWYGVRNATEECDFCIQQLTLVEPLRNKVIGSEDCLCINIYTPSVEPSKKLPVLFWLHGGAHQGMTPEKKIYGPHFLLEKDIILVTCGYRLGVLSFLTTGDEVIPGNYGMKDQVLALRWVRDNIAQFGGDVDSITLGGESSGAGCVHLHMVSPLSKDLFHRAILESGSGLCPWGYSEPEVLLEQTKKVANLLGCPFGDSKKLLSCLQKASASKIVDTNKEFVEFDNDPVANWNPTIEKTSVKGAFLTQSPWNLTPKAIPLLCGFNYAEGGFKTYSIMTGAVSEKFAKLNAQIDEILPMSLLYENTAPDPQAVTAKIRAYFLGSLDQPVTQAMTTEITSLYGDAWFTNGVLDTAERNPGPTYLYYLDYNQTISLAQSIFETPMYLGACHMDELLYLFPMNNAVPKIQKPDPSNPEYQLSLKMVDLWASFVTTSTPSSPGVKWEPVKTSQLEYLHITNSGLSMKKEPLKDRRQFWKTLKLRK